MFDRTVVNKNKYMALVTFLEIETAPYKIIDGS